MQNGAFAFCAGNPIRFVDPNGEDIWELDNKGNIVSHRKYDELDAFYMVENVDGAWQRTGVELVFKPGTEISSKTYTYSPDNITVSSYDVYKVRGDDVGNTLFKFLADNITGSPSSVEIGQIMTGIEGDKGLHFITTSHTKDKEASIKNLINGQVGYGYTVREVNHSHSVELSPSWSDIKFAVELICEYKEVGRRAPQFHIYHVPTRQKVPFSP